jgi:hypothetical protein
VVDVQDKKVFIFRYISIESTSSGNSLTAPVATLGHRILHGKRVLRGSPQIDMWHPRNHVDVARIDPSRLRGIHHSCRSQSAFP